MSDPRPWMESEADHLARLLHEAGEVGPLEEAAYPVDDWLSERVCGATGLSYVDWKADKKWCAAEDWRIGVKGGEA